MEVKMEVNDVLERYVGSFGRYQIIVTTLGGLGSLISATSYLGVVYLTATPHFWYVYDGEELNYTIIQERIDVCEVDNGTAVNELQAGYWQFDDTEFRTSIVSKVNSNIPDSKVRGANMGPIWGRQDPGGPLVGPMNFPIWDVNQGCYLSIITSLSSLSYHLAFFFLLLIFTCHRHQHHNHYYNFIIIILLCYHNYHLDLYRKDR